MGEIMGEPFSDIRNVKIGNSDVYRQTDTVGVFINGTYEIEEISELLRQFYNQLGSETNYVLIALYVPVIPIAFIANVLVIFVVFRNHYMRSATNFFVVNLSMADLLVTTICMPMAISQAVSITWLYDEIICKLFFYLQGVAVAASVFTITAMSVDRYLAIKSPIAIRRVFNRKMTAIVIMAIWLASLSIFGPVLKAVKLHSLNRNNITLGIPLNGNLNNVQTFTPPSRCICSEDLESLGIDAHVFGIVCFILVYAIPGTVVVIMYLMMGRTLYTRKPPFDCDSIKGSASSQQGSRLVKERKRVAWILLILAILFALCWLPYNVLRLILDLKVIEKGHRVPDVLSYCLFIGHLNSMLNPIVYCIMTRNFRRSIAEILCRNRCHSRKRKPHRNTLAVVTRGCSSRDPEDRISLSHVTFLGKNQRKNGHRRGHLKRSTTISTVCDNSNSRCSSAHRSCYKSSMSRTIQNDQQNSKNEHQFARVSQESLNDVTIIHDVCHAKKHSQSLQSIETFNNEYGP